MYTLKIIMTTIKKVRLNTIQLTNLVHKILVMYLRFNFKWEGTLIYTIIGK